MMQHFSSDLHSAVTLPEQVFTIILPPENGNWKFLLLNFPRTVLYTL